MDTSKKQGLPQLTTESTFHFIVCVCIIIIIFLFIIIENINIQVLNLFSIITDHLQQLYMLIGVTQF